MKFFTIEDHRFVQGKVYVKGCKGEREPIIDVCVAGLYKDRRDLALILDYSCAGYIGHPDGWIPSFGYECDAGGLYASAFTYDKIARKPVWYVGRSGARVC